ncbi:precorrin-2 C20-methyltransferase /cobalt-factor II C20-methyltransferase [Synechococcus sp. Ace-Pa]|nr:precorrin-2 C20-methyltransferase /cobalt-factor II C20-methyltransferase [Synechococcus sp. Ace-Pa]
MSEAFERSGLAPESPLDPSLDLPLDPQPGLVLVGVGPGDPDLLTVAAVRAIRAAEVVAYPVGRQGGDGMAAAIAAPWLTPQQDLLPLLFPMVAADAPRRLAWRAAADRLAAEVAAGRRVVLLCEGDVSLFASASYALLALAERHPNCPLRLIPGITALAAAAAAAHWPLALQQQGLLVRTTPDQPEALEALLDQLQEPPPEQRANLVLLKLGRRWSWVRPLLARRQLLAGCQLAQRLGWPDELLAAAEQVPAAEQPYFSLLLIRLGWPEVLP